MDANRSEGSNLRLAFLAEPNELAAREWMSWFADRGHGVDLIVGSDADVADGLHPAISLRRMPQFGGRAVRPLAYLDARRAIRSAIHASRPDVLHVHYLTGRGWLAAVSGFHPYVVTPWGSDLFIDHRRSAKERLFGTASLRLADLVTANSRHVRAAVREAGARPSRVREIQFGVDTSAFTPGPADEALRARLGLAGRRIVFSPRQIAPIYDHLTIIRAMAGLPPDVAILMSDRNAVPEYRRLVDEEIRVAGLVDRVVRVDAIPHEIMADYLRLADVVVSVPVSDATPVTVLEAMACGIAVVASDLLGPREWLEGVYPDLIAPVGDIEAVRCALFAALDLSPDERRRRGEAGRQIVQERAERGTNMLRMEGYYRSLARGGNLA